MKQVLLFILWTSYHTLVNKFTIIKHRLNGSRFVFHLKRIFRYGDLTLIEKTILLTIFIASALYSIWVIIAITAI